MRADPSPGLAADSLLEIRGLRTHFFTSEGVVKAVDGVDLVLRRGRTLCVLGESGCGKSITARSVMQLVDRPGRVVAGEVLFRDRDGGIVDLAALDPRGRAIRAYRGSKIALIFQEPMTAFSPVYTIGKQIVETILLHRPITAHAARDQAIATLRKVGIPDAEQRMDAYPFQLSGGMRQRAMIALALCCEPQLLIADEPTTALDVTTQATILDLMRELQRELGMGMIFITHDLGVVAEIADDVAVMYLGQVVEQGSVEAVFERPRHPYTQALLASVPKLGSRKDGGRLTSIRGMVPHPFARPDGCGFHPRCDRRFAAACSRLAPALLDFGQAQSVRCHLYDPAINPGGYAPQGQAAPA